MENAVAEVTGASDGTIVACGEPEDLNASGSIPGIQAFCRMKITVINARDRVFLVDLKGFWER